LVFFAFYRFFPEREVFFRPSFFSQANGTLCFSFLDAYLRPSLDYAYSLAFSFLAFAGCLDTFR